MLTRKRNESKPKLEKIKQKLKYLGWSYRSVAPIFGVHFVHLALVLNGHRQSKTLINSIENFNTTNPKNKKQS